MVIQEKRTSQNFSYQLEPRKKYHCPQCNKKTFSRYIAPDGQHLHESAGKCDRSNNCAYHLPPREFFKKNPTERRFDFEQRHFEPITTTAFIPNFSHPIEKSYSFELADVNSEAHRAVQSHLFLKTGIPTSKQKSYGFEPISKRTNLKNNRVESFTASNFAFAIVPAGPNFNIKIKNPTSRDKKFKTLFGQNTGNYFYGLDQLPEIEKRKDFTLFIVEGEEKSACINYNLSEFGIYAITRGGILGGAYCPYFQILRAQFENVFVWFDNDKAGRDASLRLKKEHGLKFVDHSKYENVKDINDIFTNFGRERLFEIATSEIYRLETESVHIEQKELQHIHRDNAFSFIEADTKEKIIICETSFFELGMVYAQCYNYNEISKIGITNANIYVYGSCNFHRKNYLNAAQEIERLQKIGNNLIFVDEQTHPNFTPCLIHSNFPSAHFVEIIKKEKPENVQFLDTSESVNRQLEPLEYTKIKRTELYAANKNKKLYVLYDANVQVLPEAFLAFNNVVFVLNAQKKDCVSMANFCHSMDKLKRDFLNLADNDFFRLQIEKVFFETIKNKKNELPIRYDFDLQKPTFCNLHARILETQHRIKLLCSDPEAFKNYVDNLAQCTTEQAVTTTTTEQIFIEIQQTKRDLAKEKKQEYFDFLNSVSGLENKDLGGLAKLIAETAEPTRGAKIAYARLNALLKIEPDFDKCFVAVNAHYVGFSKVKGRFLSAHLATTNTKIGKMLKAFKKETENQKFTKSALIEIARCKLNFVHQSNEKTTWIELKKICKLPFFLVGRAKKRVRHYEAEFKSTKSENVHKKL